MTRALLTLNAGSSSLKFALYGLGANDALDLHARGQLESITQAPHLTVHDRDGHCVHEQRWAHHGSGFHTLLGHVLDWCDSHLGGDRLVGVGHRIVHGGPEHDRPQRLTPALIAAIQALVPLAPLHLPHNLEPVRAVAAHRPKLAQVACFDTAFHHAMPEHAKRFALPDPMYQDGVRRYGFHGLSYAYIAERLRQQAPELAAGRVIVAHLGNGASVCAMRHGHSQDTSMGFTALDGLVMGTRCGRLDPGVVLYLLQHEGLSADDVQELLYKRSGLLGVSGIDADMRTLLASHDPAAERAVDLFVYRLVREIGALVAVLGGVDGLVFTAGIGEHAAPIRARTCAALGAFGVQLDETANQAHKVLISAPDSRVQVRVMATDEEHMIAAETRRVLAL
ncbi:acetate/propionate family kinase [Oleiagrimonas sp. C23AA]|uniref:acetate/propionate family kinase n=1 Tax=Oleiagrimonas sp. C23AA TaxID=2719047 RepID=UPI0014247EFD|nr:acetate/propionate family kinase [Oleiagrimonas sp. C23AA]NII09328.1 acetate/propionate family kinase [Oleiagrimonas sp. C23AA]